MYFPILQSTSLCITVLIDVLLTEKAVTLIFISGRGLTILTAQAGKSGSIYNLAKSFLGLRKRACIS